MRRIRWLPSLSSCVRLAGLWCALASQSCSYNARWQSACNISFSLICARQVECGQAFEQAQCESDLHSQLICDPGASLDEIQACRKAASAPGCEEAVPEVCLAAMCDATLGCVETSPNQNQNCQGDPPMTPDGQVCEPEDTGAAP